MQRLAGRDYVSSLLEIERKKESYKELDNTLKYVPSYLGNFAHYNFEFFRRHPGILALQITLVDHCIVLYLFEFPLHRKQYNHAKNSKYPSFHQWDNFVCYSLLFEYHRHDRGFHQTEFLGHCTL